MIDAAFFITLAFLGIKSFLALRRERAILREFGRTDVLSGVVLLYPVIPAFMLLGPVLVPRVAAYGLALVFFSMAMWLAIKQSAALDRFGTDRVKRAMHATSTASVGALVGIIYVCLATTFLFIGSVYSSRPLGA